MKKLILRNKLVFIILILMFAIYDVNAVFPESFETIDLVTTQNSNSGMSNRKCYNASGTRYTCPSSPSKGYEEWKSNYKKGTGSDGKTYVVICANHEAVSPAGDGVACSKISTNTYSNAIKSGVAAIINKAGPFSLTSNGKCYYYKVGTENRYLADGETGCVNEKYVQASITISKFLSEKGISDKPTNNGTAEGGCKGGCPSDWLTAANNAYDAVINAEAKAKNNTFVSIGNVTQTEDDTAFYLTIPVISNYKYEITSVTHGSEQADGRYQILKSDLSEGDNTITIEARASYTVSVAEVYSCGSGFQTLTPAYTEEREVVTDTATKTITLTKNSEGIIKIKKVNASGNPILNKNVSFNIFDNETCVGPAIDSITANTGGDGIIEKSLSPSTIGYWIKESTAPQGYQLSNECVSVGTVTAGQIMTDSDAVKYENVPTCVTALTENPSISNRLELYKKYGYRNLLNFTITDATDACSQYEPKYVETESCLYVDEGNTNPSNNFTNLNLSDYNDTITGDNDSISYCLTRFLFYKELGYDIELEERKIKAGRLAIGSKVQDINDRLTSVLEKKCYIYKDEFENYRHLSRSNIIQYNNYIQDINVDGKALTSMNGQEATFYVVQKGDFYELSSEIYVDYMFNPVYAYKMSGRVCEDINDINSKKCTFIGYGVLSEFQEGKTLNALGQYQGSFSFSITPAADSIFEFNSNNICEYTVEPEIIKYNEDNGKIDLEFRSIDTNTPFGRDTNTNWCTIDSCSSNNDVVKDVIKNSNNSYNVTGAGAMYTNDVTSGKIRIVLTPDIVKQIRDYNVEHPYDDYELSCDRNGENCGNAFLKEFNISKVTQ